MSNRVTKVTIEIEAEITGPWAHLTIEQDGRAAVRQDVSLASDPKNYTVPLAAMAAQAALRELTKMSIPHAPVAKA